MQSVCLYRVLVVAAFKTYELADLRTNIRFENFSHSTMFLGTKFPGIRIEKLDKSGSGDRFRPTINAFPRRRSNKQNVSWEKNKNSVFVKCNYSWIIMVRSVWGNLTPPLIVIIIFLQFSCTIVLLFEFPFRWYIYSKISFHQLLTIVVYCKIQTGKQKVTTCKFTYIMWSAKTIL